MQLGSPATSPILLQWGKSPPTTALWQSWALSQGRSSNASPLHHWTMTTSLLPHQRQVSVLIMWWTWHFHHIKLQCTCPCMHVCCKYCMPDIHVRLHVYVCCWSCVPLMVYLKVFRCRLSSVKTWSISKRALKPCTQVYVSMCWWEQFYSLMYQNYMHTVQLYMCTSSDTLKHHILASEIHTVQRSGKLGERFLAGYRQLCRRSWHSLSL